MSTLLGRRWVRLTRRGDHYGNRTGMVAVQASSAALAQPFTGIEDDPAAPGGEASTDRCRVSHPPQQEMTERDSVREADDQKHEQRTGKTGEARRR